MQKLEIHSYIEINANPAKVWEVFLDTSKYFEWNPFIKMMIGKLAVNESFFEVAYVNDFVYMPFAMKIKSFQPPMEFIYESSDNFFAKQMFFGHHRYLLEEIGLNKTRFSHTAFFDGVIPNLQKDHILTNVKRVHIEMNEAMKKRIELVDNLTIPKTPNKN